MPADAPGIQLDVHVRLSLPHLHVHYRLINETERNYGAFCRIPSTQLDGSAAYLPETIYVDFEGQTAHLRKLVLPIPAGLTASVRILPGIMLIPAHRDLTERLPLTIPLLANNPYRLASLVGRAGGKPYAATTPCDITEVTVSIGVFECRDDEKYFPLSPGYPGVLRAWPPGGAMERQVVLSSTLKLDAPVPALDYGPAPESDHFH